MYNPENTISKPFDDILYTHPALFIIEFALFQTLIESGVEPEMVIGSSLGEYTAAAAAKAIFWEDSLEMVIKQAEIVKKECKVGGMIAILDNIQVYYDYFEISNSSEIVANNFESHFIISDERSRLKTIEQFLNMKKISNYFLPIDFGFHSIYINPAKKLYLHFLKEKFYKHPIYKYISCVNGKAVNEFSGDYFWDVIRKPILFKEAFENIKDKDTSIFIDLSPSGTLSNFIKYNLKSNSKTEIYPIMLQFGSDIKRLNMIIEKYKKKVKKINKEKDKTMKAYVFPGQGSQKKGMGKDVFTKYAKLVKKADKILGYSIEKLCLEDNDNQLNQTQFTQPALYVVNAITYMEHTKNMDNAPDYLAGHSLGEYNALLAAEVFDFETGLKLVQKRGELMAKASGGSMASIIGMSEEKIREVLKMNQLEAIDVANFNSPDQIVVSGQSKDIADAKPVFENAGARLFFPLPVSAPSHSRYMEPAIREYDEFLKGFEFKEPKIPVISNVTARPYKPNENEVREKLVSQIVSSVKWVESIRYIMGKGVKDFKEIGVGAVLTGLIKKILKKCSPLVI